MSRPQVIPPEKRSWNLRYYYRNREKYVAWNTQRYQRMTPEQKADYLKRTTARNTARRDKDPVKFHLSHLRAKAKQAGVDFDLTKEWYEKLFARGCAGTGIKMTREIGSPWHVEIDRIIPGGNYTMDNCRLVCAIFNRARMTYTDEDVFKMAEAIVLGSAFARKRGRVKSIEVVNA